MARRRMIDPFGWKERQFKKATLPVPLRNEVITRDKGTCQYCGKIGVMDNFHGRLRVYEIISVSHKIPFEIDHVIAEFKGGLSVLENLKLSCRKCNRSKRTEVEKWQENG
jgi:5-methylcytosine-specific restriction endonuclease McrA